MVSLHTFFSTARFFVFHCTRFFSLHVFRGRYGTGERARGESRACYPSILVILVSNNFGFKLILKFESHDPRFEIVWVTRSQIARIISVTGSFKGSEVSVAFVIPVRG